MIRYAFSGTRGLLGPGTVSDEGQSGSIAERVVTLIKGSNVALHLDY